GWSGSREFRKERAASIIGCTDRPVLRKGNNPRSISPFAVNPLNGSLSDSLQPANKSCSACETLASSIRGGARRGRVLGTVTSAIACSRIASLQELPEPGADAIVLQTRNRPRLAAVCPPLPRCVAGCSVRNIPRGAGLACANGQQGSRRT